MNPATDRLVIATVSYKYLTHYYVASLAATYQAWSVRGFPAPLYASVNGVYGPWARNMLVRTLRGHPDAEIAAATGLLFVEQDHEWRPEDVFRLIEHTEDFPGAVIGAMYPARLEDLIVGRQDPRAPYEGTAQLVPAEYVGMGFAWVPWVAFERVPFPWYETSHDSPRPGVDDAGVPEFVGDDVLFCRKAREAGIPVFAAMDLKGVRHGWEPPPRGMHGRL